MKIYKKKFEQKIKNISNRKFEIASGKIINFFEDHIEVDINKDLIGKCYMKDVTDFKTTPQKFFVKNQRYHFQIKGLEEGWYILSYKSIHPEEVKKKTKPIPTKSHSRNLFVFLKREMDKIN